MRIPACRTGLGGERRASPCTSGRAARRRISRRRHGISQLGQSAGQKPSARIEQRVLGGGSVETDGIGQRDHGLGAEDEAQGVGHPVEVLLREGAGEGAEHLSDQFAASPGADRHPLVIVRFALTKPLLQGDQSDPAERRLIVDHGKAVAADGRLEARLWLGSGRPGSAQWSRRRSVRTRRRASLPTRAPPRRRSSGTRSPPTPGHGRPLPAWTGICPPERGQSLLGGGRLGFWSSDSTSSPS